MDPSGVLVHGSVDFYLEVSLKKLEDIFIMCCLIGKNKITVSIISKTKIIEVLFFFQFLKMG